MGMNSLRERTGTTWLSVMTLVACSRYQDSGNLNVAVKYGSQNTQNIEQWNPIKKLSKK